jgi:hypothetical protein
VQKEKFKREGYDYGEQKGKIRIEAREPKDSHTIYSSSQCGPLCNAKSAGMFHLFFGATS